MTVPDAKLAIACSGIGQLQFWRVARRLKPMPGYVSAYT